MSDYLPPDHRIERRSRTEALSHFHKPRPVNDFTPADDKKNIAGVLRRHVWLILLVLVATAAPTFYFVSQEQSAYQATASIRIVDVRGAITSGMETREQTLGRGTDFILSQLEVLRGWGVLSEVVDREGLRLVTYSEGMRPAFLDDVHVPTSSAIDSLHLKFSANGVTAVTRSGQVQARYNTPLEIEGVRFTVRAPPGAEDAILRVVSTEAATRQLRGRLAVRQVEKTDVVTVSYSGADPYVSQRVTNALVEVFQSYNAKVAQQRSHRRRIFLEEQLHGTDSLLTDTQLALAAFRNREQVFSSREKFIAQQQGLMNVEIRREELDADRRMLQSLLTGLNRAQRDGQVGTLRTLVSSPGISSNPVVSQLYNQLVQYETEREAMTTGPQGSTAAHPSVQRLDALIASTQSKLTEAIGSYVASLEARIAALDDLRSRSSAELRQAPRAEAEELRLVQQLEGLRKMSDQLREELHNARMAEAVEIGQVEIVHPASTPFKTKTRRSQKIAFGILLGLVLGISGAFTLEARNTSIRQRTEMERVLHVPGLAIIPKLRTARGGSKHLRLGVASRNGHKGRDPEGDAVLASTSEALRLNTEAYRILRANLILSQHGRALKSIAVTSATPREGKTTTATNLAIAYALQGTRVLLMDCDQYKPCVHEIFNLRRSPGLTDLLRGQAHSREVIQETAVPRLHVVSAGLTGPDSVDLLSETPMYDVLARLSEGFDLLILDAPPLLATADAAILASIADGVVLVIRAGQTDRTTAQEAAQQLELIGAHVVGAVLNDPDAVVPGYDQYIRYYASATA